MSLLPFSRVWWPCFWWSVWLPSSHWFVPWDTFLLPSSTFNRPLFLLISKYTKHKLTIIRCQSQRLIWRRSESYNVLLSYNENKINKYSSYGIFPFFNHVWNILSPNPHLFCGHMCIDNTGQEHFHKICLVITWTENFTHIPQSIN